MTAFPVDPLFAEMQALARNDQRLDVFGAFGHRWQSARVPLADVEAFEQTHGLTLPAGYRRWITLLAGAGAGPFYGLSGLPVDAAPGRPFDPTGPEPLAGTLALTHQGCGYTDHLVLSGPHAGEVWIDLREGDGPLAVWYPTFEAWLGAWLRRSLAEWAAATIPEGALPKDVDPGFLERCRVAAEAVLADADDPMLVQYPVPHDKLLLSLAVLAVRSGQPAEALFEQAAAASREPDGVRAIGRCVVAEAAADAEALLAAADAGLSSRALWHSTRLRLLRHRRSALEALERWDEGLLAIEAIADHVQHDVHAQYDLVWVRLLRGETALAAARLHAAAERGTGGDRDAPVADRARGLLDGLMPALTDAGMAAEATALETALLERLGSTVAAGGEN